MRGAAWVLGGMLATSGCRGSAACADLGGEVLLTAQVTDNGEQTRVEVELRRAALGSASISVKLCDDDALWVDAVEMLMVKRPSGGVVYEATLAPDGETMRYFTLHSDDEVSEFTAELDAPDFAITAPSLGSEVPRATPLEVTWDPPRGGDTTITVKLADAIDGQACLGPPLELEEPDDGEVVIDGAMVKLNNTMAPADGACEAFVTLSRGHSAALKPTSGSATLHPKSSVRATTSRTVAFTSVP
jgi:hypothetical protein